VTLIATLGRERDRVFTSVGAGIGLLLIAVVVAIMTDNPWIKLASVLYLGFCIIIIIISMITDGIGARTIIPLSMILLVGMYVHRVHHMFDPKDRNKDS